VPTLLHLLAVVLGVNHFDRGEQFLFLLHISKVMASRENVKTPR